MKIILIVLFVLTIVNGRQITNEDVNNNLVSQENRQKIEKHRDEKSGLMTVRQNTKMGFMLLHGDKERYNDSKNREDERDEIEDGNKIILKFGKRVFESIKSHGIIVNDAMKMGKYRIDWWKEDRRLERIRKRLSDELERKPELKNHLHTLGWRNSSEKISDADKVDFEHTIVKKPTIPIGNDATNALFYKNMMTGFESLIRIGSAKTNEEHITRRPTIYVWMKIELSSDEIDNNKEIAATETPDSPTKFSLNKHDQRDFQEIGVSAHHSSVFSGDVRSPINSSGQSIDTDRLLQLIPLIIDELRNDRLADDERRSFARIFGKRLWQLLEREASKRFGETMDRDLAMFLVKGELVERDPEMARRTRRRQRRSSALNEETTKWKIARPIIADEEQSKKSDLEYDYDDVDVTNGNERTYDWSSSRNFDPDERKSNDPNVHELIDLVTEHESREFEKRRKFARKKNETKSSMEENDDDYYYENHDEY